MGWGYRGGLLNHVQVQKWLFVHGRNAGNSPSSVFLTALSPSPTTGQGCYLPLSWVLLHRGSAQTARCYCLVQHLEPAVKSTDSTDR